MTRSLALPVLVAEGDANDMFLFTRLLKASGVVNPLHIALNGREAVELLTQVAERDSLVARPCIVFLDVQLPERDGFDVLTSIRSVSVLDNLPVVMLTHVVEPRDILRAQQLGAQCYLTKYPGRSTITRVLEDAYAFYSHAKPRIFTTPDNLLK